MSLFPKKMPVWLVVLLSSIVVLTLLLISPLSNPIKIPLQKKIYEIRGQRYTLDSPDPNHRHMALSLIKYNQVLDDALIIKLAHMATEDSNARVRVTARIRLHVAAERQVIAGQAISILTKKLQQSENRELPQLLLSISGIAGKHNKLGHSVIMNINRIAEKHADSYSGTGQIAIKALGNIGLHQPLPDASLETLTRILQDKANSRYVFNSLVKIVQQRPLSDNTIRALIAISGNHEDMSMRSGAIKALGAHCKRHPCEAGWFERALNDKNKYVRDTATQARLQMKIKEKGEKRALMEIVRDHALNAPIRNKAAFKLRLKYFKEEEVKSLLLSLADDPDATMRLVPLSYYPGLDRNQHQTNPVWLQRIKKALADPEPRVRIKAIYSLVSMRFDDSTKIPLLIAAMQDKDVKVRSRAIDYIRPDYYKDLTMRAALDKAVTDPDIRVQRRAKLKKQALVYRTSGARKSEKSRKKIVGVVFWVLVFISAIIAIGYLVYYVIRFIIYLAQRSWKAMAVILVILGWFAASAGMAFALFIAIFAGLGGRDGHFYILLGLFVAMLVYAAIGWGLRYPIRR